PDVFAAVIDELGRVVPDATDVDFVAGVEARGFLFAGALAYQLGCGTLAVRKAGQLPPPTLRRPDSLEYRTAGIAIPDGLVAGRRVLLIDDVLATGGTMRAAGELLVEAGATVPALAVVLELDALRGRDLLAGLAPLYSLLRV